MSAAHLSDQTTNSSTNLVHRRSQNSGTIFTTYILGHFQTSLEITIITSSSQVPPILYALREFSPEQLAPTLKFPGFDQAGPVRFFAIFRFFLTKNRLQPILR